VELPIPEAPPPEESAGGYMLRLLSLNGANVSEVLAMHRQSRRRHLHISDVELFSKLSGVSSDWFDHRTPRPYADDRWREVALFGFSWREDWLLRGQRQQICPLCLNERGIARLEWDLVAYSACHIHKVILQDTCRSCEGAISPDRPALDICNCGGFVAKNDNQTVAACESLVTWTAWLSHKLLSTSHASEPVELWQLTPQIEGSSPDGAYRIVHAFAGGVRAFRGELLRSAAPWLSSRQVSDLLTRGLRTLAAAAGTSAVEGLAAGTPDALAEQAARGITATDRAIAARILRRLRVKVRRRHSDGRLRTQGELFEDAQ